MNPENPVWPEGQGAHDMLENAPSKVAPNLAPKDAVFLIKNLIIW